MTEHLPILQVVLPLLAAPACLLLNNTRVAWCFTLAVSAVAFVISVLLLQRVLDTGVISYDLGGWDAPWGIEYRIDLLNAYVLLIVCTLNLLALIPACRSVRQELASGQQIIFFSLHLLCFAGLLGITATGDAFNVFVFLEISSLATYALIALGRERRALWAAFQYLIIGTIGASFILIGIGLLYAMTGTLNMLDLADRIPAVADSWVLLAAFVFIIVGICIKLALFPLHFWLPNAYAYAPSIVSVFVAATSTKVAAYLLIRFTFTVFGFDFSSKELPLDYVFVGLGLIAVFVGSILAIYQSNIKRLFAYSSVAQIGYIVIGFGLGTLIGLQASLLHIFNHALMKGALFMALAAVMYRLGGVEIQQLRGLGQRMPWTMAAIVLGGLSLIGMPLTVGFVSKWYLIRGVMEAGLWPVALLVVAGSLLAVIYVWRLVETAYFQSPDLTRSESTLSESAGSISTKGESTKCEAPLSFLIPLWLLIAANLYFGMDTRFSIGISEMAAQYLFGVGGG